MVRMNRHYICFVFFREQNGIINTSNKGLAQPTDRMLRLSPFDWFLKVT